MRVVLSPGYLVTPCHPQVIECTHLSVVISSFTQIELGRWREKHIESHY